MDYDKLLKKTAWKRKRKLIIDRDGGKCTVCQSTNKLVVHHTYYYQERIKPWLYPDDCLITLCEECHNDWHKHHEIVVINNPIIKRRRKQQKKIKKGKISLANIQQRRGKTKYRKKINGQWVIIEK